MFKIIIDLMVSNYALYSIIDLYFTNNWKVTYIEVSMKWKTIDQKIKVSKIPLSLSGMN